MVNEGSNDLGGAIDAQSSEWTVSVSFGQNTTGTNDGGTYITLDVTAITPAEASAQTTTTAAATDWWGRRQAPTTTEDQSTTTSVQPARDRRLRWRRRLRPQHEPARRVSEGPLARTVKDAKVVEGGSTNGTYEVIAGMPGTVANVWAAYMHQLTEAGYRLHHLRI